MADADWHLYRQLRGKELPATFDFQGTTYRQLKLLKRDFYAAVGLYERAPGAGTLPDRVLYKVYHTESFRGLPLGWLGRWLCRRETRCYENLAGVSGVPRHLGSHGEAGIVREYVPGCNLREYRDLRRPGPEFYPELLSILDAVHACGLSHNDLNKPENILVTPDGRPVVIDFQIALGPHCWGGPLLRRPFRRFLRYMQWADRYHLMKHYIHDRPEAFTPEQIRQARDKGLILRLHGLLLRRPYRAVRHAVVLPFLRHKQAGKRAA